MRPYMPLLQSRFPGEGRYTDKIAVHKSPQIEVVPSCGAKAKRYGLNEGRSVLFDGFPECERFVFERLQPKVPPS